MINCHMDNQIQFQKVGDDSPRTPGKEEGSPLLQAKKEEEEKKNIPGPFLSP